MGRKQVQYFFAFQSPFAALADSRIDDLIARAGAELIPVPVVPPPAPPPQGIAAQLHEFRMSYAAEDAERWARKLGLSWQMPEPRIVDTTDAAAGYYCARDRGKERGYRNAVFHARWGEGRHIGDHAVLADCAETAGVSRAEFLDALQTKRYHDEVPKALQRCFENRIFGVPIFVVDGQRFWGNDRIDVLMEELERA